MGTGFTRASSRAAVLNNPQNPRISDDTGIRDNLAAAAAAAGLLNKAGVAQHRKVERISAKGEEGRSGRAADIIPSC